MIRDFGIFQGITPFHAKFVPHDKIHSPIPQIFPKFLIDKLYSLGYEEPDFSRQAHNKLSRRYGTEKQGRIDGHCSERNHAAEENQHAAA
jgi:hypothetical protein